MLDAANAPSPTTRAGAAYRKGTPGAVTLVNIPWSLTGAAQNGLAKTLGLSLNRIEDGHWDPDHRNDFYFLTTEGGQKDGTGLDARDGGGLWRLSLRRHRVTRPRARRSTLLLDGSEILPAPASRRSTSPTT